MKKQKLGKIGIYKKWGILFILLGLFLFFVGLYLMFVHVREIISAYSAIAGGIFTLFVGICYFLELPHKKLYLTNEELKIVTKFFRTKERIIPISNIEKAYIGVDMSYKYFIKQSETTEFLTTVIIFKENGKRIMRFINQNNIVDFNRFVKALKDKGVEVTKISFDIKSQKDFVENVLREEYKRCDRVE